MRPVFHFDFMEFCIEFHGKILVALSVFIITVLFLLSKLAPILFMKVFGWNSLVGLFVASCHLSATISCIPLSDCGTSGLSSLSFQGIMYDPCALTR
jgi:hypothetical protein